MGCASSKQIEKWASPPSRFATPRSNFRERNCAVEYFHHQHIVTLTTSSSCGLLKIISPNPSEPIRHTGVSSLTEMVEKLRSFEANGGDKNNNGINADPSSILDATRLSQDSRSSSSHAGASMFDSAEYVVSAETISVQEMMTGLEEAAPNNKPLLPADPNSILNRPYRSYNKRPRDLFSGEEDEFANENEISEYTHNNNRRLRMSMATPTKSLARKTIQTPLSNSKCYSIERERNANNVSMESISALKPSPLKPQKNPPTTLSVPPRSIPALKSSRPGSPLFDPDLVASYEKAMKNVSEDKWNGSQPITLRNKDFVLSSKDVLFSMRTSASLDKKLYDPLESFEKKCPPGGESSLVLYTTTLRGIRKTFEDCNTVRDIVQSYGLSIDERDVSMHLGFLNELRQLMGRMVSVPRIFIKGRYIGGVQELVKLHEDGKLSDLVEGLPKLVNGGNCDGCDGVRFVPCLECRGSCKIRNEGNEFERCPDCNENGLIQCPICT